MSAAVTVAERIGSLVPEMIVFGGSVVVSVTGLSPKRSVRAATPFLSVLTLIAALVALTKGWADPPRPDCCCPAWVRSRADSSC